jgi:hypothetical protein
MMFSTKKSLALLDRQIVRVNVTLSALSFNKKLHEWHYQIITLFMRMLQMMIY